MEDVTVCFERTGQICFHGWFIAESQMEHFVKLALYLLNHEIIQVLLYTWTLGAWTLDAWTLDAWTLVELTLEDWTLDASTLNSEETAIYFFQIIKNFKTLFILN